jgi:hypothetical protein
MKKLALLLLLTFVFVLPSSSLFAQTVINFDNLGWSSNQLLASTFTAGDLTFTSAKTTCTNFGYNLNVNNVSVYFVFENTTSDQLIVQTSNSTLVNFNSIAAYQVSQSGNDTLVIEGWNGTNMLYSVKFNKISAWKTLTLNYENVNKLVIKSGNKSGKFDYDFDNLSYSPATPVTTTSTNLIINAYDASLSGDVRLGTMTGQRSKQSVYFIGTKGGATFSFNLPKSGQWYAWARMYYMSSGSKNAFYLTANNKKYILGDNDSRYNKWNWDGYTGAKISLGNLSAGVNKILISGYEYGTTLWVDQLLLTDDPNFVPTDENTSSTIILLNANSGTLSGDVRLGTMTGQKNTRSVYFVGTSGGTTLKVTVPKTGNYYAWARMYYMKSGGKNSFFMTVNSKQYILGDNDNKYNQWYWDGYKGSKIDLGSLTAGTNTIKISGREPGTTLWVDQIVITDNANYDPNAVLGKEEIADAEETTEYVIPEQYSLEQNYPNPFNPSTTIRYNIPSGEMVKLIIYDVLGNEVSVLVNEYRDAGQYEVSFNASNLASGVYYYSIKTGSFNQVKKMMLLK